MKTENVVLGEERIATPIFCPEDPTKVIGTRIEETVFVRIIDFGLAKYLNVANFASTPSPGVFSVDPGDMFANTSMEVTPTGTDLYMSLEFIQELLSGVRDWKTKETVQKVDVYGAGTILYCMVNGKPPYYDESYEVIPEEEVLKSIARKMQLGPQHTTHCPRELGRLINLLMQNSITQRPIAANALGHKLFQNITNKYVYEVYTDGRVVDENLQQVRETEETAAADSPTEVAVCPLRDLTMKVVRALEDDGVALDVIMEQGIKPELKKKN